MMTRAYACGNMAIDDDGVGSMGVFLMTRAKDMSL